MLFNSYLFLFGFLPSVFVVFYALPRQAWRVAFLVAASYAFYAYAAWWFPLLMVGTTAISYLTGRLLDRAASAEHRGRILATGVAGSLGLLVYFKYAQFVVHGSSSFLTAITGRGLPSV